jgi:hypothetical protein
MAYLKNIHLLDDISEDDKLKMEEAAVAHKRYSNIEFKILEYTPSKVIVRVTQGKSAANNYQTAKRLVEIVSETYGRFFNGKKIMARPYIYQQSPANDVNDTWINNQMTKLKIGIPQIVEDTGIDKTQLTSLITGNRPLSQPMKALFWYYFLSKK